MHNLKQKQKKRIKEKIKLDTKNQKEDPKLGLPV